jgi:Fe-S oxidoreductase
MDFAVEQVERKCLKDAEKGDKEINIERTEDALETNQIIAAGCPFCNTMMTDGIKNKRKRK